MALSRGTYEKANRLREEGRVDRTVGAEVWTVTGDHDRYYVIVEGGNAHCTCPSSEDVCSHILAVAGERVARRRTDETAASLFRRATRGAAV